MQNQRKPGLDLIRIFSALLVIICHSGVYFSIGFSVNFVSFAGVIAVEFFFVLSGFLVGKSSLKSDFMRHAISMPEITATYSDVEQYNLFKL